MEVDKEDIVSNDDNCSLGRVYIPVSACYGSGYLR